jgi:metal-responsive CopG/Arc/MetJ family transcriptional regulator
MKTAISIDDDLLHEADRTAKQLGLSRSRLFSVALEAYLRHRRNQEIVERLNRAYAGERDPEDQMIVAGIKRKLAATIKDRW